MVLKQVTISIDKGIELGNIYNLYILYIFIGCQQGGVCE